MAEVDQYSRKNLHEYIEKKHYAVLDDTEIIALGRKCTSLFTRMFMFFSSDSDKKGFYIRKANKEIAGYQDAYLESLDKSKKWIEPLLEQLDIPTRRAIVPKMSKRPEEREKLLKDALRAKVAAEFGVRGDIAGKILDECLSREDGYQNDLLALRELKKSIDPKLFYALVDAASRAELSLLQPKTITILKSLASLTAEGQKEQLIARTIASKQAILTQKQQLHTDALLAAGELLNGATNELRGLQAQIGDIDEKKKGMLEVSGKVRQAAAPQIALIQSELKHLQSEGAKTESQVRGLATAPEMSVSRLEEKIAMLKETVTVLEKTKKEDFGHITIFDKDPPKLVDLKAALKVQKEVLDKAEKSLKELNKSEEKRFKQLSVVTTRLDTLSAKIASKKLELAHLTSPVEEHDRQIAVLSNEHESLMARQSVQEAQNKDLASQIASQESAINELQNQIATLESTVRSNVNTKDLRTILHELIVLEMRPPETLQSDLPSPVRTTTEDVVHDGVAEEAPPPSALPAAPQPKEIEAVVQGLKDNPLSVVKFLFPMLSPLLPNPSVKKEAQVLLENKDLLEAISKSIKENAGPTDESALNIPLGILSRRLNNAAAAISPAAAMEQGMQEATKEIAEVLAALTNQAEDIEKNIIVRAMPQLKGQFSQEVNDYVIPGLFAFLTMVWERKNKSKAEAPMAHEVLSKVFTYKGMVGFALKLGPARSIASGQIVSEIENALKPITLTKAQSKALKACIKEALDMVVATGITKKLLDLLDVMEKYVNDKKMSFATLLTTASPALQEAVALINKEVISKWNFDKAFTA